MTNSQQPSIDILKKRASKYSGVEGVKIKSILLNIASDVSRLQQEPTTDKYSITKEIIEEWQSNTDISKWEMHTFWNFINNKTK